MFLWFFSFFCRLHVLQLSEESNPVALKSLSSQHSEDSVQQPSRFFRQLAKETLKSSISPANHVSWSVSTKLQRSRQISTTNKTMVDGLKLPLNQTQNHLQPWVFKRWPGMLCFYWLSTLWQLFSFCRKKLILAQCVQNLKDEDYFQTCHELGILQIANNKDGCNAILGYDMPIALYVY